MKRIAAILIIVAISTGVLVFAQTNDLVVIKAGFDTGNDYVQWSRVHQATYAAGFVNGLLMAPMLGAPKRELKWLEDPLETGTVTNDQIAAIIRKFLDDHPERRHEMLNSLSFFALRQAFKHSVK